MKRIIYVHGRGYKPNKDTLKDNWDEALIAGLQRDYNLSTVQKFKSTKKEMAYYGDLTNIFLKKRRKLFIYDEKNDIIDRSECLNRLKSYSDSDFQNSTYSNLPGKDSIKKIFAHLTSKPLYMLGLGNFVVGLVAPDMKHYWNPDDKFGSDVRWRLTEVLKDAFDKKDEILLISHSLGTIIAYDVLWKFSYYGEYRDIREDKLHTWITMGSPLGNENAKKKLKGANATGVRKYPINISRWFNVAAEDDYLCHDQRLNNDFEKMEITTKSDTINYNLAVRHSKSNPHHAVGYLITPEVVKIVANWLDS